MSVISSLDENQVVETLNATEVASAAIREKDLETARRTVEALTGIRTTATVTVAIVTVSAGTIATSTSGETALMTASETIAALKTAGVKHAGLMIVGLTTAGSMTAGMMIDALMTVATKTGVSTRDERNGDSRLGIGATTAISTLTAITPNVGQVRKHFLTQLAGIKRMYYLCSLGTAPGPSPSVRDQRPSEPQGDILPIGDLIDAPGRFVRPPKFVIILRGLPGSGKTYVAKLVRDRETELGTDPPRILSLDDYFECDGEYEYEADLEPSFRQSLVKSFRKQIDDGYFKFIMVDAVNDKNGYYEEMWSYAKQKGFEVSIKFRSMRFV